MRKYNTKGLILDPSEFQHPADKAVSDAIRKAPGFSKILEFISKNSIEKLMKMLNTTSYIRLTERTSPELFAMLREAMEMFGVEKMPDLFLFRTYEMTAYTEGIGTPCLKLSSEWLKMMDQDAAWGCLASTIAGIRNGFCELKFVETILNSFSGMIPDPATQSLKLLFVNWKKYAQFSLDRAQLLATGNFDKTVSNMLCGKAPKAVLDRINFEEWDNPYHRQCKEFGDYRGMVGNTVRNVSSVVGGGAYLAARYMSLLDFYNTEYFDILDEYL